MAHRTTFAGLLKKQRLRKELTARALSLRAGLGPNYVHNVELGRWIPRPHAVTKLAAALDLSDPDTVEFRRAAGIEPDRTSIPDFAIWEHLPELVYRTEHDPLAVWDAGFDPLLGHLVPAMASLLAWVSLTKKAPARQQRNRLKDAARMCFDKSLAHNRESTRWVPIDDPIPAAGDARSFLPRAWRMELFADRRSAVKVVNLLKRWSYLPASYRGSPRLAVRFKDSDLDDVYRFAEIPPPLIVNTHDAMVACHLGNLLDLTSELGAGAQSCQESDLAGTIGTGPDQQLSDLGLRYIEDRLHALTKNAKQSSAPAVAASEATSELVDLRERAKFALRVFQLPEFAASAIACTEAELRAALAACAEVLHDPNPRHRAKGKH